MQVRVPINLFTSCCGAISKKSNPPQRKAVKAGLVSKDGMNFFPFEFVAVNKKVKKTEDDAYVKEEIMPNPGDTMRPLNLKILVDGSPNEEDENGVHDGVIIEEREPAVGQPSFNLPDESIDLNHS